MFRDPHKAQSFNVIRMRKFLILNPVVHKETARFLKVKQKWFLLWQWTIKATRAEKWTITLCSFIHHKTDTHMPKHPHHISGTSIVSVKELTFENRCFNLFRKVQKYTWTFPSCGPGNISFVFIKNLKNTNVTYVKKSLKGYHNTFNWDILTVYKSQTQCTVIAFKGLYMDKVVFTWHSVQSYCELQLTREVATKIKIAKHPAVRSTHCVLKYGYKTQNKHTSNLRTEINQTGQYQEITKWDIHKNEVTKINKRTWRTQ